MNPEDSKRRFILRRVTIHLQLKQPIKLVSFGLRLRRQDVGLLQREHRQFIKSLGTSLIGHANQDLVDPVPPVFVEQTYWDHYSVASRAHHQWYANHTRNHTN